MTESVTLTAEQFKEMKDLGQQQTEAVTELRAANKELETQMGITNEKFEKSNTALDAMETKNQEFQGKFKAQETDKKELDEKLEAMEKKLFRIKKNGGPETQEQSDEHKACVKMIHYGKESLSAEENAFLNSDELKMLRTDSGSDGGVLVIPEVAMEIIKPITEISGMRKVARVMTTSSKSVIINKRTKLLNGGWVGERKIAPTDSSNYGEEEIPVNKLMVEVIATTEMIQDSWANVVGEITTDAAEDFAQLEGASFVNGDAVKKPAGFTKNGNIQKVPTGLASALTADSIITIAGELKTGYNAVYLLNRRTVAKTRLLKGTDGHYLWQPGLATGNPNTLNGSPYVEMPDMDDVAAGKLPIAYGDFQRGYRIVDHTAMSVIRDELTLAREGKVAWVFIRRVGGQVVLDEAIKLLEVTA
jgi:HK97 family phage major capsid protein